MKSYAIPAALLCAVSSLCAQVQPYDLLISQREPGNAFYFGRFISEPAGGENGLLAYDATTRLPKHFTVSADLHLDSSSLTLNLSSGFFSWLDSTYASVAQGALADTAVQPGDLADVAFSGDYDDLTDKPAIPALPHREQIRATTNASGVYTWTFSQAFTGTPVISVTIEDTGGGAVIHEAKVTAISSTAVTVTVTRTQPVTVLSVSVLGVLSPAATVVHLTASAP